MGLGQILKEFGVKLNLDFNSGQAEKADKQISKIAADMKSLAIEVSAAAASLLGIMGITAKHSLALDTEAKRLGITTDALQELQYAAKVTADVTGEELTGSLEGLSKTLFEAQNNSTEAGQAFVRLGVVTTQELGAGTLKADVLLKRLADRFAAMPDGMAKTGLAASVGLEKLLPLLNKGSAGIGELTKKAQSLGIVMDKTMIDRGVKFNESLESIWAVTKNITYLIGGELIKSLQGAANDFQKWIVANRKFIASGITTVMKQLTTYLGYVFKTMSSIWSIARKLTESLGGLEKVAHYLAVAFGLFASYRLVFGITSLLKGFMGLQTILAGLMTPIGIISAGLVLLFLLIQDFFSDDSLLKEWAEEFQDAFPNIADAIVGVFDVVKTSILDTIQVMESFFGWFMKIGGAAGGFLKSIGGKALSGLDSALGYLKGGPSGDTASGGNTSNTATNNMQANITVQVPPGTGAKQATNIVSQGVQDGFDSMLRNTRNQFLGGQAY